MATNDKAVLKSIIQANKVNHLPNISDNDFFEIYVAEQLLKNYDLSYEELEYGLVGAGGDGGIDCIYTFVNENLIAEDSEIMGFGANSIIELFIIQTKMVEKFKEDVFLKFDRTTSDLLILDNDLEQFSKQYNSDLLRNIGCFKKAYLTLSPEFPKLRIRYTYATLGDAESVHPNVISQADKLRAEVLKLFSDCEVVVDFFGAKEILELSRKVPQDTIQLRMVDTASSPNRNNRGDAYVGLVTLKDYYKFITDENGNKRQNIFDSNVRGHQEGVDVNKEISKTLESETVEDFWWLNNGITVIASKGKFDNNKILTLKDPQIVNGLQTSEEIYHFFNDKPDITDARSLLVKIIVTEDINSRESIIRATNRQTSISSISLKAFDKVQRDIDSYFLTKNFYYDRKKNYYKKLGKKRDRIITIPYLAQAVIAILLKRPNDSKGRPTSLIDKEYDNIFNNDYPIDLYLTCTNLMRFVEKHVKLSSSESDVKKNLRFQIAMYLTLTILGKVVYTSDEVATIKTEFISPEIIDACIGYIEQMFYTYSKGKELSTDRIVKSKEFDDFIIADFQRKLDKMTQYK